MHVGSEMETDDQMDLRLSDFEILVDSQFDIPFTYQSQNEKSVSFEKLSEKQQYKFHRIIGQGSFGVVY